MKKITILIGIMILLAIGTVAFNVGNNLSQQQLDNLNIGELDLANGFLRDENNKIIYDCETQNFVKICKVYGNFTTIRPNYDEDNTIIDYPTYYQKKGFLFRAKTYRDMKLQHNLSYARQQLKDNLESQYAKYDIQNKNKIQKYQSEDIYDIDDIMDGIDLQ